MFLFSHPAEVLTEVHSKGMVKGNNPLFMQRFSVYLRLCLLLAFEIGSLQVHSQSSEILDTYIREALDKSLRLREASLQLESRRVDESVGQRLYLPELTFGTSYTLAAGGRSIYFPIGDLLNPVYGTLNQLTQSNAFPSIDNVEEQFLPNNFYDARFRLRQPILRREIEVSRKLYGVQRSIAEIQLEVLRRELVKEIKMTYFGYLQASALLEVMEHNQALLRSLRKVQEGLIRNGKLIPSALERNAADVARLDAQAAQIRVNQQNAAGYLNFLLARDAGTPIAVDTSLVNKGLMVPEAMGTRPELAQLEAGKAAADLLVDLQKAKSMPSLGAQLDVGSQASGFDWGGYALLGISLEIPLWSGGRQKLQVQRARIEAERVDVSLQQALRAMDLEVQSAVQTFQGAVKNWESFPVQVQYAQRNYRETLRRYEEGMAGELELQDAQTQLQTLEIQQTVARYAVLLRYAEMERAMSTYGL